MKIVILLATLLACLVTLSRAGPLPATYNDTDNNDDDTEIVELITNSVESPIDPEDPIEDIIDLSHFNASSVYGEPDQEITGELVANYTPEGASVNPEELGSYLEGDILMPGNTVLTKNGLATQTSRWPGGIVPFEIGGHFAARDLATIERAIEEYHRRTCIRFVRRSTERDYISIVSGNSGCWSSVGRVGGKQEVNLQSPGCLTKIGTPIHELMHALGFLHEQNRQERDSFVSIQYQNIQPHAMTNFEKASNTMAYGVPYDYASVMHYSANAFSTNGRPTIVAMQPGAASRMGQRDGFSPFDVEKLNKMYNCGYGAPAPAPAPIPMPSPGPAPMPIGPGPGPVPAGGAPPGLVGNFLGGFLTGLGLGDEEIPVVQSA